MPIWSNDPVNRTEPPEAFQNEGFDPTLPFPVAFLNWALWNLGTLREALRTAFEVEHDGVTGAHTDINADSVTADSITAETAIEWPAAESTIVHAGRHLERMLGSDWNGPVLLPEAGKFYDDGGTDWEVFGADAGLGTASARIVFNVPGNARIKSVKATAVQWSPHTSGELGSQITSLQVWKNPTHFTSLGNDSANTSAPTIGGFAPTLLGEIPSPIDQTLEDVAGATITASVSGLSEVVNPETEHIEVYIQIDSGVYADVALYSVSLTYETTAPGDFT